MGFHVRNADGEMTFPSFREVHNAYLAGLIEPDDEIREEGTEKWRRASTLPMLKDVPRKQSGLGRTLKDAGGPLILGVLTLVSLFTLPWWITLVLAFFAAASGMKTAQTAARPRR